MVLCVFNVILQVGTRKDNFIVYTVEVVVNLGENSDQCLKGKTLSSFFCFSQNIDTRQCLLMYIQLPSKCSRSATQFSLRPSVMKKL